MSDKYSQLAVFPIEKSLTKPCKIETATVNVFAGFTIACSLHEPYVRPCAFEKPCVSGEPCASGGISLGTSPSL